MAMSSAVLPSPVLPQLMVMSSVLPQLLVLSSCLSSVLAQLSLEDRLVQQEDTRARKKPKVYNEKTVSVHNLAPQGYCAAFPAKKQWIFNKYTVSAEGSFHNGPR